VYEYKYVNVLVYTNEDVNVYKVWYHVGQSQAAVLDERLHPSHEPFREETPEIPDVVPPRSKFTGGVDDPVNAGCQFRCPACLRWRF